MINFGRLSKTDKIVIWAPSSSAPYLFPKRFKRALKHLEIRGYNFIIGESCKREKKFELNSVVELAKEFHDYLRNDEIKGIFFATGGWSTIALFPYIDWDIVKSNPKVILGYSDATSLLLACYAKAGIKTYHGPMVISEWGEYGGPWEYTIQSLEKQLFDNCKYIDLQPPDEWTHESLYWDKEDNRRRIVNGLGKWKIYKEGSTEGILIGGNLNTLSLILGTEYMPTLKNNVLFIETENYSEEKFLAFMMQLEIHNVFKEISGLIIGRHANPITGDDSNSSMSKILDIIFRNKDFPIIIDVDLGHTEPMITLPIGGRIMINTRKNLIRVIN